MRDHIANGRIILISTLLLTSPWIAGAQTVGGRVGSAWTNDVSGIQVGGYVEFPLGSWFSFQPELLYSKKAMGRVYWSEILEGPGGELLYADQTIERDVRYLEVPLLSVLQLPWLTFSETSWLALRLNAGPSASLQVSCAVKSRTNIVSQFGELITDTTEVSEGDCASLRKTDLGFIVGGGVGVGIGRTKFIVDVRYTFGLVELATESGTKNNTLSLTVGAGVRP